MKNICLFIVTMVIFFFQSCGKKMIYDPLNEVVLNKDVISAVIKRELKIDTNKLDIKLYFNNLDRNVDILDYLKHKEISNKSKVNYILALTEISNIDFESYDNFTLQISTSLPVIDISQNMLYMLVGTSIYNSKNWLGQNEHYFVFKRLKNNKLEYVCHFESLKKINTGPPLYIPEIRYVDSLKQNQNFHKIDSIIRKTSNTVPDSIKMKMGVRNN